ncbi:MAG: superoxide dismutase family protein [Elusimicrobia bacterium]|nr:superoxide dismutase family protein [Elusimicrobiota bacterium]
MRSIASIASVALGLLLAAAARAGESKKEHGVARIQGTAAGSALAGTARFEDVDGGLKVAVTLTGVPGAAHALHIHEFGDCADSGKAAGGHYNPQGAPHGHALKDGSKAHPGDFGNVAAKDGAVSFEAVLPKASLKGKNPVAGRSIVLHEKEDDFSQPAGNAGGRIACGVIVIAGG